MPDDLNVTDDLATMLALLPPQLAEQVALLPGRDELLEVVLDLGRLPEARLPDGGVDLGERVVTHQDLEHVIARVGSFSGDNRAGIERTLHRISCLRNRHGAIIGLTCRVGRSVFGTIDVIRDLVESGRSMLILGPPGVGKCVVGDTWIFTEHGMRPIAEYVPAGAADESFHPLNLGLATPNGIERTSQFYYDGVRPTRKLRTRMGYRLEGTGNHPVLILDRTGHLTFKALRDLEVGEVVAIQRGQNVFGSTLSLPPFTFERHTNAKDNGQIPTELTPGLARYLGYLIAEGTTTERYFTSFCNDDPDVVADVATLVRELFGLTLDRQVPHSGWSGRDYRIMGRKHRAFLENLGIDYSRAAGKSIPDCILRAPRELVAQFLRGFFEGEGSIGKAYGVEVSSASEVMLHQIHVLLLNFGIVSKLRARRNVRYDRDYYYLSIKGENIDRFARAIGFASPTKQAKLAAISAGPRNPNHDVIPFLQPTLAALRAQVILSRSSRVEVGAGRQPAIALSVVHPRLDRLADLCRVDRAPGYERLSNILNETGEVRTSPVWQHLSALLEAGFYFDPIHSLSNGEAAVYDFTVPGSHMFFGNGLVNHNTTKLREVARVLATDLKKRVVVIDTSNEIAGDGDIPHPAIGRARRMQVPTPSMQHAVMIEAVENHMPEVIVIDEIGTEQEALAARTIAERGVQLIGTAHGNALENLMMNPTLADLVGGIHTVTLSDEEARRRGTTKSIQERKAPPTFDICVELQARDRLAIHTDVADVVDQLLRGMPPTPEIRQVTEPGHYEVIPSPSASLANPVTAFSGNVGASIRIFPYAVSRSQLERVVRGMRLPVEVVRNLVDADAMLILKGNVKSAGKVLLDAESRQVPTYVVKQNTIPQIQKTLRDVLHLDVQVVSHEEDDAIDEAKAAIDHALMSGQSVELRPRNAHLRRLQHKLAERHQLASQSHGEEPYRRVLIYPADMVD